MKEEWPRHSERVILVVTGFTGPAPRSMLLPVPPLMLFIQLFGLETKEGNFIGVSNIEERMSRMDL